MKKWFRENEMMAWRCFVKLCCQTFLLSNFLERRWWSMCADSWIRYKKKNGGERLLFPPHEHFCVTFINIITISLGQMTIDRYHELVCPVIFFNMAICLSVKLTGEAGNTKYSDGRSNEGSRIYSVYLPGQSYLTGAHLYLMKAGRSSQRY